MPSDYSAAPRLRRFSYRSLALTAFVGIYIAVSVAVFVLWVNPSLLGLNDLRIAADSSTYIYFANTIRSGRIDPYVYGALTTFPNTVWAPVLLAIVLNSTVATVVVNYVFFFVAVLLLRKAFTFSMGVFLVLLLANPTTMISLLSVNKEILDLLSIAIFLCGRWTKSRWVVALALLVALFCRFELCAVMIVYMLAESRFNPLRGRRWLTVTMVVLFVGFALPFFAGQNLAYRFEEASSAGVIAWLDSLEMHYLYVVAVIPKILENMIGVLINFSAWGQFDTSDWANSYILIFNNLATVGVVVVLIVRRMFSLHEDLIYFAALASVLMATSLVIQSRYFYCVYVVLCLQAASPLVRQSQTASDAPAGLPAIAEPGYD